MNRWTTVIALAITVGFLDGTSQPRDVVTARLEYSPTYEASGTIPNASAIPQLTDVVMPSLSASDFPDLPEAFRKRLDSRGCKIPDTKYEDGSRAL